MVLCWVLLLALLGGACSDGTGHFGQVRAATVADGSATAELRVDQRLLAQGRVSDVFGKYFEVAAGKHAISVIIDGVRVEEAVDVAEGASYTVIHPGVRGIPATILTDDGESELDTTAAADAPNVRFVHASTAAGIVDVYLSGADKGLSEVAPLTFDFKNGDVTPFAATDKGTYRLRLTKPTQIDQVLFDSGPFKLDGQGNLSFVLTDVPGGTGPGAFKFLVLTDTGSWPLGAFDPCAGDTPDEDIASAKALSGSFAMNGLCRAGDVDFYRFDLPSAKLAVVEVSTAGLGSLLNTSLELQADKGVLLDKSARDATGKAKARVLLFGGAPYFIKIADARGAGGVGYTYELRVTLLDAAPTAEACGGNFNAASNESAIKAFNGQFVALSVRGADNKPVDYKTMVRVTGLLSSRYDFVYDPTLASDGVLRVILSDGQTALPTVSPLTGVTGLVATQVLHDDWFVAMPLVSAHYRASRAMGVAFPTKEITWAANSANALTVPTVTGVQLNAALNGARITFMMPQRATTYEVSGFGRIGAASGKLSATHSPVNLSFDAPLAADEPYAVRVQAGDAGLFKVPLPNRAMNVSEFLFYSNVE
jgi:hypothetical protein